MPKKLLVPFVRNLFHSMCSSYCSTSPRTYNKHQGLTFPLFKKDSNLQLKKHTLHIMPASQTSVELPVLDISQPLSPSSLSSISVACKEWGFFQLSNHGICPDFLKRLQFLCNHIFMLPSDDKLKAGPSSETKTYTPHFIASPFYESLRVSGPDFFASAQSSSEALLNHPNPEFR